MEVGLERALKERIQELKDLKAAHMRSNPKDLGLDLYGQETIQWSIKLAEYRALIAIHQDELKGG
jgi:hypothetical protein